MEVLEISQPSEFETFFIPLGPHRANANGGHCSLFVIVILEPKNSFRFTVASDHTKDAGDRPVTSPSPALSPSLAHLAPWALSEPRAEHRLSGQGVANGC